MQRAQDDKDGGLEHLGVQALPHSDRVHDCVQLVVSPRLVSLPGCKGKPGMRLQPSLLKLDGRRSQGGRRKSHASRPSLLHALEIVIVLTDNVGQKTHLRHNLAHDLTRPPGPPCHACVSLMHLQHVGANHIRGLAIHV